MFVEIISEKIMNTTNSELYHLLEFILNREIIGEFTSCVLRIRGKTVVVIYIEITKNDDFRKTGRSLSSCSRRTVALCKKRVLRLQFC